MTSLRRAASRCELSGARGRVRDLLRADGIADKVGPLDRVVVLDGLLARE